jgi:hypothetical protein
MGLLLQDFDTATHIHIPYTGSPHITIIITDLHHIEIIHTISKDLNNITIPPTGIHYIGNKKEFTQLKKRIVKRPM